VHVAQDAVRTDRLRQAKGLSADVAKARLALDEATDRCEGGRELVAALAGERVQVRARVREAQETASAKVRAENDKLVKVRVASLNGLFSQVEPLVSDAPSCELPA
jgi:hypothetical protein